MTGKKRIIIIGLAFLFVMISYFFIFGKLFPYSPVIIGFEKQDLSHSVIYTQTGASFEDFEKINALIPDVESFHQLEFVTKPEFFLFTDSINYLKLSPSKSRFVTFYNGRIFITPWAVQETMEGKISLDIYLRHELSHALLFQHAGLVRAGKYPEWLLEGIAVYSANQMGTSFYPSKEETYRLIRSGNFMPPEFYATQKEDEINLDVPYRSTFLYAEFACIVDYLLANYGKDKLLIFMKSLLKNSDHDRVFKEVYGMEFDQMIQEFRDFITEQD